MNAIGSQPGDLPSRLPVSHSDQGAYGDGQNASPLGRTCTKIALWLLRRGQVQPAAVLGLDLLLGAGPAGWASRCC